MSLAERVVGVCPLGCGRTLFLGDGGYVTCSWVRCPNRAAASELLEQAATRAPLLDLTEEELRLVADELTLAADEDASREWAGLDGARYALAATFRAVADALEEGAG